MANTRNTDNNSGEVIPKVTQEQIMQQYRDTGQWSDRLLTAKEIAKIKRDGKKVLRRLRRA